MNLGKIGYDFLVYDGVKLSDYFVVRTFSMPLCPTLDPNTIEIDGKPGAWFNGNKVGTRDIIIGLGNLLEREDNVKNVIEAWAMISDKLVKNEVRKLELGNGLYVNAAMVGDSQTTTRRHWSIVEVTFRCFDPYIYRLEHVEEIQAGSNRYKITTKVPTYPVFEITGTKDVLLYNENTGDRIHVSGLNESQKLVIDMGNHSCKVGDAYKMADPSVSDFWPIESGDLRLKLESGKGTFRYKEVYI